MVMDKKDKRNIWFFKIIIMSLFLIPYYFRVNLLKEIASIKITFVVVLGFLILNNIKDINKKKITMITILIIGISINNLVINKDSISSTIRNICIFIIPLYLLAFDWKSNKAYDKQLFKSILKIFNIFIIIIFLIGVIDPLIDYKIMSFISNLLNNKFSIIINKSISREIYRYSSYLGHYLFTKDLFIYFYVLNIAYYKFFKCKLLNKYIVIGISLGGVILTGSKSGVIIMILLLLFVGYNSKKLINIIKSMILIIGLYFIGGFNNIIERLMGGSLTTGRSEAWHILESYKIYLPHLFYGYGEKYLYTANNYIGEVAALAAFEYPIRILVYKYGILTTFTIYGLILIYPIFEMLVAKSYTAIILFICIFINVNTYNGIVVTPDNNIFFIIITMLLIKCCRYEKNNL